MASAELPPVPAPQGWAEVAVSLAGEGQVQVYFLLLGIAMTYCYSRCKHVSSMGRCPELLPGAHRASGGGCFEG